MDELPSLDHVREARARIAPYVLDTPMTQADGLHFKLEMLQHTGSFKPRGAFNAALQLRKPRGIVAMSGGNHGLAVAYVGAVLGIATAIMMPKTTPAYVVDQARAYGADVHLAENIAASFEQADALAADGWSMLHPFDDFAVVAGQGTVGLEIAEQFPDVRQVVVSIGGGSLICGIAATLKQLEPRVRVVGVETDGADAMRRALDANAVVQLPGITSIARTLGAPAVSPRTLRGVQTFVDDVVVVSDAQTVDAIFDLQKMLGITVEPAAACTLAALRAGKIEPQPGTLLLMCGRNVRLEEIVAWRARFAE
jgi:threonine dehydratase